MRHMTSLENKLKKEKQYYLLELKNKHKNA